MSLASFRKTLQTEVVDFLNSFSPTQQLFLQSTIPSIVSQLLYYREEGKFLYPDVYIIDDESALKSLPGYHSYKISEGEANSEVAGKAIKKCAPLCERLWSIYLLITDKNQIEYGLFSFNETVSSVSRQDLILSDKDPLAISICILRDRLITVKTKSARLDVLFDISDEESVETIENNQRSFFDNTIKGITGVNTEPVTNYLRRLFTHVFRHGHGTLACVIKAGTPIESIFEDSIILPDPIEYSSDIVNESEFQTMIIEGDFELMSGMLQSDGVTVFTDDGRVVAYNVFVKLSDDKESSKKTETGGARSRAFRALCEMDAVVAAYMQSQDGKIKYHERERK